MKSYIVHYRNKYPGCAVSYSESSIQVIGSEGLLVALAKNGAGQWVDVGEELGALHKHDLSPIPKDARAFKLYADGKIKLAEEGKERLEARKKYIEKYGHVPSIEKIEADAKAEAEAKAE